jgi:hypothetical protein
MNPGPGCAAWTREDLFVRQAAEICSGPCQ